MCNTTMYATDREEALFSYPSSEIAKLEHVVKLRYVGTHIARKIVAGASSVAQLGKMTRT